MNLIDYKEEFIDLLFSTRLPSFEFNVNTYIEKLIIAQHYGLQTRLLDFTTNPLVALFFAVFKETDSDNSVVWLIQINPKRYRLFRELKKAKPNDINETILFHPPFIDKRIQSQNSIFVYFKKPYQPLDQQYDFFGNNISYNAFTNKDDDFFSKNVDSKIIKIMIPNKYRKDLCHSLITIGIDYEKLFPDIIGSVNHINWRLDYSIR